MTISATTLLREIDAFIAARGMAETTFGRLAVNDGKFVARVRDGSDMTLSTYERVKAFMAAAEPPATAAPASGFEPLAPIMAGDGA